MHEFILHLWQSYGYWGLMGAMALEYSIVLPVPAETTLTATGILYQQHVLPMKLIWLITATALGTFFGATIAYFIGRIVGRPFFDKYGKYIKLTPDRIDRAEHVFQKYTIPTLIISRYIAFVRIFVPYIAGINRVRLVIFVPTVLITSFLWTATFLLAGSVIDRAVMQVIHHWKTELAPAIIILLALVAGYWYFHRWLNRKIHGTGDTVDTVHTGDASGTGERRNTNDGNTSDATEDVTQDVAEAHMETSEDRIQADTLTPGTSVSEVSESEQEGPETPKR